MQQFGAKDALSKISALRTGLPDTRAYRDPSALRAHFPAALARGPRVLKQNRGSQVLSLSLSPPRSLSLGSVACRLARSCEKRWEMRRRLTHEAATGGGGRRQGAGVWICHVKDEGLYRAVEHVPLDARLVLTEVAAKRRERGKRAREKSQRWKLRLRGEAAVTCPIRVCIVTPSCLHRDSILLLTPNPKQRD